MVENPALHALPFAVQQKHIIVTCNYEARRRGLRKLQLVTEAKQICPDVVIVLGEELGRFRDASKALYSYLAAFTWSGKVERLGFDEVFMDITDIVDYNQSLLNHHHLSHSFFQLRRQDPTMGFAFDATRIAGHGYPEDVSEEQYSSTAKTQDPPNPESMRLILGSHFARHLRLGLEEEMGYTSTVGISTNKLRSKLVGNINKPKGQTTLLAPRLLIATPETFEAKHEMNVMDFIDSHGIGKIPGIGFNMSQRIRNHVLSKPQEVSTYIEYGASKETVTVRDVRTFPGMGPEMLEKILGGPGAERGIGGRIWALVNGIDDTEVKEATKIPVQISIEDSYLRLDTFLQVNKELRVLSASLVKRMHTDLLEDSEEPDQGKKWTAYPKTLRLSTRPRLPLNADGTRTRTSSRISRSGPLPSFVFNLKEGVDATVERLVTESLLPMFRRLHPQPGWNLSLMNIGVTNMVEAASDDSTGKGRDISKMFKRQEDVLKEWKVEDRDVPPDHVGTTGKTGQVDRAEPSAGCEATGLVLAGSEDDVLPCTQNTVDEVEAGAWESDDDDGHGTVRCIECGAVMPPFAMSAHERFHSLGE
ncbi:DNA polymerase [Phlyctema vagabunda]|uniref:DNA polymerase n=1 Tax=Phlyctema vagabunda TaxID=108571 RepID=A0ABR4PVB5_9HELO